MEKLQLSLNKLLSSLPFDGSKTTIGLAINALLPLIVVNFPQVLVVEPVISAVATTLTALGILHKAVKETTKNKQVLNITKKNKKK